MAKFNLFDESTWAPEIIDLERQITNKALGHIGQKLHNLSVAKEKLLKTSFETEEYHIAQDLQQKNPRAYDIMGITIRYPNQEHSETLSDIDEVLHFWSKGMEHRQALWRTLIPTLKKLQPYLENGDGFYRNPIEEEVEKFKIEVSGNAAWEEYLETVKSLKYAQSYLSRKNKIVEDEDIGTEYWRKD